MAASATVAPASGAFIYRPMTVGPTPKDYSLPAPVALMRLTTRQFHCQANNPTTTLVTAVAMKMPT